MKGIYLTEQSKQEIEAEIAELEQETKKKSLEFTENKYTCGHLSGQCMILKEILASATILPVEESWESASDTIDNNQDELLTNCLSKQFPNGIIIQYKL
jgi:hypothetical protein